MINKRNSILTVAALFILLLNNLSAQYYFFGRNKVQYEDFDWKILKTEHFDIYYYDELEELAKIGANYAEESFDSLKIKFNHIVVNRIPLIFYNTHIHFQQTNTIPGFIPEGVGGFFEFLKGRVVIPYRGSLGEFRHVINHELVHVFFMSKVLNQIRSHRIAGNRYPPLWFIEGIAEYWSTEWDSQADMVLRDAVLNDNFFPLKEIYRIAGSFLMYKEGQNFLLFVEEYYGEDKVLQIVENVWRFGKFFEVLEFVLGESIEEIDSKWEYYVKNMYFPLFRDKYPNALKAEKITDQGLNYAPQAAGDSANTDIYFIGNRNGYTSLYKIPDYKKEKPNDPELVIRGEKSAEFENFHSLEGALAVSPGGKKAFVTKSGLSDVVHVIDKNGERKTYRYKQLVMIKEPSISADERYVALNAIDNKGYSDIFFIDLQTDSLHRVTYDYYDDRYPVFDKNNGRLIFTSDRTEGEYAKKYNLFSYDLGEKKVKYLTYTNSDISNPAFSPDYSEIYFTSNIDSINNLWRLSFNDEGDPEQMEKVTNFVSGIFQFDFISDKQIVYASFENFSIQLYYLDFETLGDMVYRRETFDFASAYPPWIAKRLEIDSKKDKLEYEREYSLDYAVSQFATDPVYGPRGGALLSLSDMLGNDRFLFLLYNTAEVQSEILKNFNVDISRINTGKRTNYGYGIFHYNGRRYDIRQSDDIYYERSFGSYFSLIYPFSSFKRLETSVTLANMDRETVEDLFIEKKALLVSNTIAFVHDNSLWGPTGPLDGSRYRLLLGYTTDIRNSNINYYSLIADYRHYFRLSLRSALAFRSSIYYNEGKDPRRYFAGGSWDLRGWPRWSVRGEKLWLSSLELRYPFVDQFYIKFPFFGLGFTSIRGAVFFDAGGAWDEEYRRTLGSIGTGIRINFLNAIVFRYDIGKKIENDFTTLQPGLFYQFFFGWDF